MVSGRGWNKAALRAELLALLKDEYPTLRFENDRPKSFGQSGSFGAFGADEIDVEGTPKPSASDIALPSDQLLGLVDALEIKLNQSILTESSRDVMVAYLKDTAQEVGPAISLDSATELVWELCQTSPRPISPATNTRGPDISAHSPQQSVYRQIEVPPSPLAARFPTASQRRRTSPLSRTSTKASEGPSLATTLVSEGGPANWTPKEQTDPNPFILYATPPPPSRHVSNDGALQTQASAQLQAAQDQIHDLQLKLDAIEWKLAESQAAYEKLKAKEAEMDDLEMINANLEDDKRILHEKVTELRKSLQQQTDAFQSDLALREKEKAAMTKELELLHRQQQHGSDDRRRIRQLEESNRALQQRILQIEEQRRIWKETQELPLRQKEAVILQLTQNVEHLQKAMLTRQTVAKDLSKHNADAVESETHADEDAKEQMLLLEGYMLQMEREVDRYKVESQRLKDESDALRTQLAAKHSSLEYSKTASGRQGKQAEDVSRQSEVVAQLQGQLIILKDSFDAVSKECEKLTTDVSLLRASKLALEKSLHSVRSRQPSTTADSIQKVQASILTWVDDAKSTLRSATTANDDVPLLVSVMQGNLDRHAEKIKEIFAKEELSRTASMEFGFESTIDQHAVETDMERQSGTQFTDDGKKEAAERTLLEQKAVIDALSQQVDDLKEQSTSLAPTIVHSSSAMSKASFLLFGASSIVFVLSYIVYRLSTHREPHAPEWLTRLAYANEADYRKVLSMS